MNLLKRLHQPLPGWVTIAMMVCALVGGGAVGAAVNGGYTGSVTIPTNGSFQGGGTSTGFTIQSNATSAATYNLTFGVAGTSSNCGSTAMANFGFLGSGSESRILCDGSYQLATGSTYGASAAITGVYSENAIDAGQFTINISGTCSAFTPCTASSCSASHTTCSVSGGVAQLAISIASSGDTCLVVPTGLGTLVEVAANVTSTTVLQLAPFNGTNGGITGALTGAYFCINQ